MRKQLISLTAAGALLFTVVAPLQGCYGSFALTHKLYKWNGSLGDKWINSLVMVALGILPIYGIAITVDALVLNTVEFWTGSNPAAMAPGEKETKMVSIQGQEFKITATQNHLELAPVDKNLKPMTLVFEPEQKSWFVQAEGKKVKIAEQENQALTLMFADGHEETLTR